MALTLFLLVPGSRAQSLRVTTWNLQPPTVRTNAAAANADGIRIPAAAAALRKLNPDVILLQQVTDWAMCDALAQALKPARYNVVVCSAFREARTNTLRKQQVAILAKSNARAYFSWSEPWRKGGAPAAPGGLAFAAFRVGGQRVGVFSVAAGTPTGAAAGKKRAAAASEERLTAAVGQLLAQVRSVNDWVTNRVQVCIVGGTFGLAAGQTVALDGVPLQMLEDAGFGDALQHLPVADRATMRARAGKTGPIADYIFTQPADCASNPSILHVAVSRRYPVTCDVMPGPLGTVSGPTARVEPARGRKPVPTPGQPPQAKASSKDGEAASALPQPGKGASQLVWLAAVGGGLAALAALLWIVAGRKRLLPPAGPALLAAGGDAPSGYTMVLTSQSASETVPLGGQSGRASHPLIRVEAFETTHTQTELLRRRALAAEQRAERADAVIRAGLILHLGHWLKQKLVRRLISDRTRMLEIQEAAARKAMAVEQRLARIEQQIQQQDRVYQNRIEELTRELHAAKEGNCELIRARIAEVKAERATARARLMAQSQADCDPGR
ncbi:MAG TPA: hypothetical protein PKI20_21630 [Verrucomicrobiota bacterium]|nr:hypothetical protein [Verrucomicrobiota bacterium]HQL80381.1 hypothetical protein [Verrucomicrobiota bacterium]